MWYNRARSLVTTTRTSAFRRFENVLDSDESWLGSTRDQGGTREASILSWTRFHHRVRNAAQRNATQLTGNLSNTWFMNKNVQLQSPTNPSVRQLGPPHTLVSLSPPAQRRPMDAAHDEKKSSKIAGHIVSPQLVRYEDDADDDADDSDHGPRRLLGIPRALRHSVVP